jgi:hypothetical protein
LMHFTLCFSRLSGTCPAVKNFGGLGHRRCTRQLVLGEPRVRQFSPRAKVNCGSLLNHLIRHSSGRGWYAHANEDHRLTLAEPSRSVLLSIFEPVDRVRARVQTVAEIASAVMPGSVELGVDCATPVLLALR